MISKEQNYYVPEKSAWPFKGAMALGLIVIGVVNLIHEHPSASWVLWGGAALLFHMIYGWFKDVIHESLSGLYNEQMDRSFRWGMVWFILSEIMFFVAFFGALFYVRVEAVPTLGGEGLRGATHQLWPQFQALWPLLANPDPTRYVGPTEVVQTWGLPALNTLLLLSSGVTVTWAHWALKKRERNQLIVGLILTIFLGFLFLYFQAKEYHHAYHALGLTLGSGIYGSTFFMLTGFHGAHVTLGATMLTIILLRVLKGHFTPEHHFAFEAVSWYWHFVDVVWLGLFIFVYWL